jgi:hypothetical protein
MNKTLGEKQVTPDTIEYKDYVKAMKRIVFYESLSIEDIQKMPKKQQEGWKQTIKQAWTIKRKYNAQRNSFNED